MAFSYVAFTRERRLVEGTLDATTRQAALRALREAGWRVVCLDALAGKPCLRERLEAKVRGVPREPIIAFSKHLAVFLESGIALLPALQILEKRVRHSSIKRAVSRIIEDVREGLPLSRALAAQPQVFPPLYARLLGVGEKAGDMVTPLRQATADLEKRRWLAKKLAQVAAYPLVVMFMALMAVVVTVTVTLPRMVEMYQSLGVELPLLTRALLGATGFIVDYRFPLLLGLGGLIGFLLWAVGRPWGRRLYHRLLLKLPVMGNVLLTEEIARFARTMHLLLRSGISITEALDMARQGAGNTAVGQALDRVYLRLMEGQGLSESLSAECLFPPLLAEMVMVGEETGTLDENLTALAQACETEVGDKLEALAGMMEPALILLAAGLVGFVAISTMLPMYSYLGSVW